MKASAAYSPAKGLGELALFGELRAVWALQS